MENKLGVLTPRDFKQYGRICGSWGFHDIFRAELSEFPSCCGIHILKDFYLLTAGINSPADIFHEALSLVLEQILPKVRLLYITHNETDLGLLVINGLRKLGYSTDHIITSNHPESKRIHVFALKGTLSDPTWYNETL